MVKPAKTVAIKINTLGKLSTIIVFSLLIGSSNGEDVFIAKSEANAV